MASLLLIFDTSSHYCHFIERLTDSIKLQPSSDLLTYDLQLATSGKMHAHTLRGGGGGGGGPNIDGWVRILFKNLFRGERILRGPNLT